MDDRELLELAAKAAGIGGGWGEVHSLPQGEVDCSDIWMLDGDDCFIWNPLTDDGDALRLLRVLELDIQFDNERHAVLITNHSGISVEVGMSDESGDIYAPLRRAIVRAGAEIGRTK
jgi:hypothetical protein